MTDLANTLHAIDTAARDTAVIEPLAYTPEAAARAVGRSRTRIFLAIRDGELVAKKDGRATLIPRDELARWLASLPTAGQPAAA